MGVAGRSGNGGCVDSAPQITIRAASWSDEVAAMLARGIHDNLVTIDSVRNVRGAELFEILAGAQMVGAVVLQRNVCERGAELVVVCSGSTMPGYGTLTRVIMPWLEGVARNMKVCRVRVNVCRPGMGRLLEGMGYASPWKTYLKELD